MGDIISCGWNILQQVLTASIYTFEKTDFLVWKIILPCNFVNGKNNLIRTLSETRYLQVCFVEKKFQNCTIWTSRKRWLKIGYRPNYYLTYYWCADAHSFCMFFQVRGWWCFDQDLYWQRTGHNDFPDKDYHYLLLYWHSIRSSSFVMLQNHRC